MNKKFDVLLLGYYGFGNLGDELLAEAAVSLLTECGIPKNRIAVLSSLPAQSAQRLGIAAFNRWSLKDIARACSASKVLMLGGGGLFQESTSLRSCFYYYSVMKIARLYGLKILAEGQSVGPLVSSAAKFLARKAFLMCSHVSVRDDAAMKWMKEWDIAADRTPDLVSSLSVRTSPLTGGSLLVNVRPGYGRLSELTLTAAAAAAKQRNLSLAGTALAEEDVSELRRSAEFLKIDLSDIILLRELADYEHAAADAVCAVGMRLHFLVLGYLAGIPCAGCSYDPKVAGFCASRGIPLIEESSPLRFSETTAAANAEDCRSSAVKNIKSALNTLF